MDMDIRFHPKARAELLSAARYYESKVPHLGEDFLNEIERVCQLLQQRPQIGTRYLHGTYRILTPRFPFAVVYRVAGSWRIEVIAVAHQRRRPGYWKEIR